MLLTEAKAKILPKRHPPFVFDQFNSHNHIYSYAQQKVIKVKFYFNVLMCFGVRKLININFSV